MTLYGVECATYRKKVVDTSSKWIYIVSSNETKKAKRKIKTNMWGAIFPYSKFSWPSVFWRIAPRSQIRRKQ